MFRAVKKDGSLVWIDDAMVGEEYFCPTCGNPLMIKAKNSEAVSAHFAHKKGVCLDCWSHDMSEWHRAWQEKFPQECREVIVEKNGIKHRADVLIGNTVIEFQYNVSAIKNEEIRARNAFYISCGYRVVWVFNAIDKIKNNYADSIDPMKCRSTDLRWKRAKSQFSSRFQDGVTIYLQYRTPISAENFKEREFDILLLLKNVNSQGFTFYPTYYYIQQANFLREYGIDTGTGIPSVSQILSHYNSHRPTVYHRLPVVRGRRC